MLEEIFNSCFFLNINVGFFLVKICDYIFLQVNNFVTFWYDLVLSSTFDEYIDILSFCG